jgi:hypothetical protein
VQQPSRPASNKAQLAKQLVDDIAQQARDDAQALKETRVPGRDSRRLPALILVLVLIALTGWNLARARTAPVVFSADEELNSLRVRMFLAVEAIQDYRERYNALPRTLAAAGVRDSGWSYSIEDSVYTVTEALGTLRLTYHSDEPLEPLAEALRTLRKHEP